ncbi:MAG TPA: ankyrin repeat domain-containing protein [Gammaproteobacteria bacterium]|nr:ankyrin repeat domain-containing protein [Gammaproteobacteria bacterium]
MRTRLAVVGLAAAAVAGGALFVARHGSAGPSNVPAAEHRSLLDAAENGDGAGALAALRAGADVNARGADGATALIWAAYNGDLELVTKLIAAGADVEARNDFGAFALSEAAMTGSAAIIKTLLAGGAKVDGANAEGETALMEVARTGNLEAAKELIKAGADVNAKEAWGGQSPLMWAAAQSQPEMIKLLLANGADVNARGTVREWQRKVIKEPRPKDMNNGGFTPLLYAAREGCIECAKALVAGGADLNLPDPQRLTPLVLALLNLHFDLASYLIDAGADVNKWDLYGRTPLYMAADTNTLPVMGNGAMVVLPSMDKLTGLDVARQLLDKGADPNIQLKRRPPYRNVPQDRGGDSILSQGATPLLRAARAGDAELVDLLLKHGALVDLPSNQGVTPLMAAAGVEYGLRVTRGRNRTMDGVLKTMQLLLDAGADINARELTEPKGDAAAHQLVIEQRLADYSYDYRGRQVPSPRAIPHRTALHGAAMKGFNPIVEFLAAHGADLYAKDANGRTALDLALGDYNEPFLRQKAEPHTETAALLKTLMAANPASGEATARAGGDGGSK